jgi:hypothetical protein
MRGLVRLNLSGIRPFMRLALIGESRAKESASARLAEMVL